MNVTVEVNTVAFEAAMQRLREGVRRGIMDAQYGTLPVQARLLAERCQDFTPPIGRKNGTKRMSPATAKQAGVIAIKRDLHRIFYPVSHVTFEDKGLRDIVKTNNIPAWDAVSRWFHKPAINNTKAINFSQSWHKANRISRGRARGGGQHGSKPRNLGFVTLGPEGKKAREYTKSGPLQRMGWARAGWNSGIIKFGGSVTAGWIARHGLGSGFAQLIQDEKNPAAWVGNTTSWARYGSEGEGKRIVRNAIESRARDMQKYFETMMRVAAAKAQGAST